MIKKLTISNYALIEKLELNFQSGFTVLTGETGSGKSILLGALGLVLGDRADLKSFKNKDVKCVVEAVFSVKNRFKAFFMSNDLDYEDDAVLRREITPSGKSRSFINDTPVNLTQLKELSELLIDVHSQHQTIQIKNSQFQLSILDSYVGANDLLVSYTEGYKKWKSCSKELETLKEEGFKLKSDADYFQFQFNELDEQNLEVDLTKLEQELSLASNAETIKSAANDANSLLSGSNGVVVQLSEIKITLDKLADLSPQFAEFSQRINSSYLDLSDLANELDLAQNDLDFDPTQIAFLTENINSLNGLLIKHGVSTTEGLIEKKEELESKLEFSSTIDEQITKKEEELEKASKALQVIGSKLTKLRSSKLTELTKELQNSLAGMNMDACRFQMNLTQATEPKSNGYDDFEIYVQTNAGSNFLPIDKAASGGELSRIMLALKQIMSQSSNKTIIFDEIDTGVSGEVATKMGLIMKQMATNMQVFSITHLPQIAGLGNAHLKVFKTETKGVTQTYVTELTREDRVVEIATMLSGKQPTDAAIENAKELLN